MLPEISLPNLRLSIKLGYIPDLPDARDYTKEKVKLLLKKPKIIKSKIDLRPFCPPIFNQGEIGACTANAAAGLLEYCRMRALGKDDAVSRMFIYKCTRDLMMQKGDSGAYLRTTMGSLALFGACPEKYWAYDANALDKSPPAFCYSYAQNYQALTYFRLDEKPAAGISKAKKGSVAQGKKNSGDALSAIKETLSQGLPAMFGFTVFDSIKKANDGKIPYPEKGEAQLGGHAVLCVGYDDGMEIGKSKGTFLIRNSWGEEWGEKGYGWLPYDYLIAGLAQDWWALVKAEWIETGAFEA